jgi:hypothetical protein
MTPDQVQKAMSLMRMWQAIAAELKVTPEEVAFVAATLAGHAAAQCAGVDPEALTIAVDETVKAFTKAAEETFTAGGGVVVK